MLLLSVLLPGDWQSNIVRQDLHIYTLPAPSYEPPRRLPASRLLLPHLPRLFSGGKHATRRFCINILSKTTSRKTYDSPYRYCHHIHSRNASCIRLSLPKFHFLSVRLRRLTVRKWHIRLNFHVGGINSPNTYLSTTGHTQTGCGRTAADSRREQSDTQSPLGSI